MQKIHIYGAYAGLVPFGLLSLLIVFGVYMDLPTDPLAAMLLFYSGMIACFSAGKHWLPSMKNKDTRQAIIALAPSIICLLLFFVAFRWTPVPALIGTALVIGALYRADMIYLPEAKKTDGYPNFRLRLTAISAGFLVISALALMFD